MSTAGRAWKTASHYEVLGLIGQGGMGSVYKARDRRLDRLVALKFLSTGLLGSSDAREAFQREAQAIAALNHPNIAVLYDVGETDDTPFLALEYLAGGSLEQRGANRQLPISEILEYSQQLASGLSHAHGHGIIHRDVKPANALFADTGILKLVDFGLAQWRYSGVSDVHQSPCGTPQYMAPELLAGRDIDQRCDVFAFGVLLYRLAAGCLPFDGLKLEDVVKRISREPPVPLDLIRSDIPRAYVELVDNCLQKDAAHRPSSMALIRHELEMMEPPGAARPMAVAEPWDSPTAPAGLTTTSLPPSAPPAKRLPKLWWAAIALALAALAIAASVTFRQFRSGGSPPDREQLVVVLPFHCKMPEASAAGFCGGLHADLLPRLNQTRQFQSAFWTVSAAELAGMSIHTAQEAGSRLRANLAIQGVVELSGGEYRVHLDLTDARDARLLRSRVVSSSDTLALPGILLAASLDLLSARITASGSRALSAASTTVPESYQLAVQAQGLLLEYEGPETIRRAAALLERAIALDPKNAVAHALLSQAWQQEFTYARDPAALVKAGESAEEARRLKPQDPQVMLMYGLALRARSDLKGAIRVFEEAVRANPTDPEGYRLLGIAHADNRQDSEALDAFKKAMETNPRWWPAWQNRGFLRFKQGKTDLAAQDLETALSLAPGHADILRDLGVYYQKLGRIADAERSYEKSLAIRITPRALTNLAYMRECQKRLDEAVRLLDQAAQLSPNNYIVFYNLAAIRAQMPGQENAVRESAAKAATLLTFRLKVSPKDADAWSHLGVCRARLREIAAARKAALTALRIQPLSINVLRSAAIVAVFEGKKDEAAALLVRAVNAGESPAEILRDTDLQRFFADPAMRRRFEHSSQPGK